MSESSQTLEVCRYIVGTRQRTFPADVLDEARGVRGRL